MNAHSQVHWTFYRDLESLLSLTPASAQSTSIPTAEDGWRLWHITREEGEQTSPGDEDESTAIRMIISFCDSSWVKTWLIYARCLAELPYWSVRRSDWAAKRCESKRIRGPAVSNLVVVPMRRRMGGTSLPLDNLSRGHSSVHLAVHCNDKLSEAQELVKLHMYRLPDQTSNR
ncbi:hypothetical protein POX_e06226 [Penicillium oxalicum]|uniref:hypothetical protein n=1 Tax=Penicillium oxalicum TaxID=69781 RepID=UPI0020B8ADD0|nr:hypothetical protein POX_e06226 [Penicillium oxalicum]KAI2788213.1 hypothetical protein POX_e06226 [Penicillium oxalicum]